MVHKVKVKGGVLYRFGKNPPTSKQHANAEMRAAFANGYRPKPGSK